MIFNTFDDERNAYEARKDYVELRLRIPKEALIDALQEAMIRPEKVRGVY